MHIVTKLLLLFLVSQLLGVYSGIVVLYDYGRNPYVSGMVVTTDTSDPFNAVLFAALILIGAGLMIFLIKMFHLYDIVFQIMEFFLVAMASSIVFYSIMRVVSGYEISMLTGIIFGLILSILKRLTPLLKNTAAVLATAGVGVIFGLSLAPIPAILFLVFLSLYDYASVFITKHMIEFANFVIRKDLAFTVTAKGVVAGKERRIDLGTGDLIAPILLEVSVLPLGFYATAFVFLGAFTALCLFLFLVWEKRMVLPALPPLVFGMFMAFLAGMLLGLY
ncbi:MAG: presenilin family intramembrane aspartyl protease [Candidatus Bilamarchaeaceae archaeon]